MKEKLLLLLISILLLMLGITCAYMGWTYHMENEFASTGDMVVHSIIVIGGTVCLTVSSIMSFFAVLSEKAYKFLFGTGADLDQE